MGKSNSSYAMATKSKAMYGKRLLVNDYQELLHRRSVSEIAAYLKNETYYSEVLEGINEHAIHRGHLESLIRQSFLYRFIKLMKYGDPKKSSFLQYGILLVEIKQILVAIRSFTDTERYIQLEQFPTMLEKYVSFDLKALLTVNDYNELLKVVKDTIYYKPLLAVQPTSKDDLDYTTCEITLKNLYYETMNKVIDKQFKGQAKKDIKAMFGAQIELDNITKIYRLKKYYKAEPDFIKRMISPTYQRIPQKVLYEWIEEYSAEEFLEALSKSFYKKYIDTKDFVYIEYHTSQIKYNLSKHNVSFATDADLILLSYLQILEVEMQNIIDIIEGVRYNVDVDKIARLLIY